MNFGDDVKFLQKHTDVIVLQDKTGQASLAVVPQYQGRVMTSTANGPEGSSFGWINYDLISSGRIEEQINVFGGEDRFWLGPEGGQFSIFFKNGDPFDLEHWIVPKEIDSEPFELSEQGRDYARFRYNMQLKNYSDFTFELEVQREIRIENASDILGKYGIEGIDQISAVAYASTNQIVNSGKVKWSKKSGLLSIWILAMLKHSPNTTVVIPYNTGPEEDLGPVVNDVYFGKIAEDRLKISDKVVYFKGDGQSRGKIGLSAMRSTNLLGSYNADDQVLTVVEFNKRDDKTEYVNSLWEIQEDPFNGDVINSYNDGPAEPGAEPFGPFYELETSSPAADLEPGESITHLHRTIHLTGPEERLDALARQIFGVSLQQIVNAL